MKSASGTPGRRPFPAVLRVPAVVAEHEVLVRPERDGPPRAVLAVLGVVDVAIELEVADDELAPAGAELQRSARPRRESPRAAGRRWRSPACRRGPGSPGGRRRRTRSGAVRPGSEAHAARPHASGPCSSWFRMARPCARGPTLISALTASAPSKSRQAKLASGRGGRRPRPRTRRRSRARGAAGANGSRHAVVAAPRRGPALPCGRRGSSAGRSRPDLRRVGRVEHGAADASPLAGPCCRLSRVAQSARASQRGPPVGRAKVMSKTSTRVSRSSASPLRSEFAVGVDVAVDDR